MSEKASRTPQYCKDCALLWTRGAKNGKHDRHCCHFGKPAPKVWKHCKENGGKVSTQKVSGRAACGASAAPTGCASNGDTEDGV